MLSSSFRFASLWESTHTTFCVLCKKGRHMNTQQVIALARDYLRGLAEHEFDVLEMTKPVSPKAAGVTMKANINYSGKRIGDCK